MSLFGISRDVSAAPSSQYESIQEPVPTTGHGTRYFPHAHWPFGDLDDVEFDSDGDGRRSDHEHFEDDAQQRQYKREVSNINEQDKGETDAEEEPPKISRQDYLGDRRWYNDNINLVNAFEDALAGDLAHNLLGFALEKKGHLPLDASAEMSPKLWHAKQRWHQSPDVEGVFKASKWTAWPIPLRSIPQRKLESLESILDQDLGEPPRKRRKIDVSAALGEQLATVAYVRARAQFETQYKAAQQRLRHSETRHATAREIAGKNKIAINAKEERWTAGHSVEGSTVIQGSMSRNRLRENRDDSSSMARPVTTRQLTTGNLLANANSSSTIKSKHGMNILDYEFSLDEEDCDQLLRSDAQKIIRNFDHLLAGIRVSRASQLAKVKKSEKPRSGGSKQRLSIKNKYVDGSRVDFEVKPDEDSDDAMPLYAEPDTEGQPFSHSDSSISDFKDKTTPWREVHVGRRREPKFTGNPRDWSDVLAMAASTGWNQDALQRTITRCSKVFGESMSLISTRPPIILGGNARTDPILARVSKRARIPALTGWSLGSGLCPHKDSCGWLRFQLQGLLIDHIVGLHGWDPRIDLEGPSFKQPAHIDPTWSLRFSTHRCPEPSCKVLRQTYQSSELLRHHIVSIHGWDANLRPQGQHDTRGQPAPIYHLQDDGTHNDGFLEPIGVKVDSQGRGHLDGRKVIEAVREPEVRHTATTALRNVDRKKSLTGQKPVVKEIPSTALPEDEDDGARTPPPPVYVRRT